jgi:hypothetical protein
MSTPHPEQREPAQSVFGTFEGQSIGACLPFHLVDSDDAGTAHTLATAELELPADLLIAILFLTTRPDELADDDQTTRWGLIAGAILTAGAAAIAKDFQTLRVAADQHPDPDALVWWENCRTQVGRLFDGRPTPTITDQTGIDQSTEEA